jgi:chromate transporter
LHPPPISSSVKPEIDQPAPTYQINQPKSRLDLFLSFTVLALQGFGGVLAVVQRELVERKKWLTNEEFVEQWSVAQIMPGPNVVNLGVMIGQRTFGASGALVATAGLLCFPLALLLVLACLYSGVADTPWVQASFKGMNAVVAGLIIATALKLCSALSKNPLGWTLSAVVAVCTFAAVALMHVALIYVLTVLGGLSYYLSYKKTLALEIFASSKPSGDAP